MVVQKIKVLELPEGQERIETGAVEFIYPATERQKLDGKEGYTDWPSYNIRGDNAFHLAMEISQLEKAITEVQYSIPEDIRNRILWHLHTVVGIKDDIVGNTIVGGKEKYPTL